MHDFRCGLALPIVAVLLGVLGGSQADAGEEPDLSVEFGRKRGNVENGTAYDKAFIKIGNYTKVILPDDAAVRHDGEQKTLQIYMKKTLSFGGHPPEPISIKQARRYMGCAVQTEKTALVVATYGEWHSIEGGARMRLLLVVPKEVEIEKRPRLSGEKSIGGDWNGIYLTKPVEVKEGYWYGPASPGAGWEAVPAVPDLERRALAVTDVDVKVLNLSDTQVTDIGVKDLAGLKNLQVLVLARTRVTDAGLKELANLKTLQALNLNGTNVTDAGLKQLAGLQSLQRLDLNYTNVTEAGVKELAGLTNLQWLDLSGTNVTDAGLKHLAGLQSLDRLDLNYTNVTDAGLKELAGLKNLSALRLTCTKVTDAGLKELAGMKSLSVLALRETRVTDAGAAEFLKARPKCYVQRVIICLTPDHTEQKHSSFGLADILNVAPGCPNRVLFEIPSLVHRGAAIRSCRTVLPSQDAVKCWRRKTANSGS